MATFRKFKNAFKGNITDEIWINIDHIVSVFESINYPDKYYKNKE